MNGPPWACAWTAKQRPSGVDGHVADGTPTGCWASSGYNLAGCAQLEQKLRQCMDAPVRREATLLFMRHTYNPLSGNPIKGRTTSTTTCRGCTRRSSVPTSEIRGARLRCDCTLEIPYSPTQYETTSMGGVHQHVLLSAAGLFLRNYVNNNFRTTQCLPPWRVQP